MFILPFLVSIETTNDWLESENMILIVNKKKIIGTQSALPVSLWILIIEFVLCSYYFFWFLLKLPMIDYKQKTWSLAPIGDQKN